MRRLLPILCNHAAVLGLGMIGVKLTSRWVSPSVFGAYTLFTTLAQLGYLLTHAGLINHGTRYWQRERAGAGAYARFLWGQFWRQAGYLAPLLAGLSLALAVGRGEWIWLGVLPFLWVANVSVALAGLANGTLNAQESHWRVLAVSVVNTCRTLLPLGLAAWLGASLGLLTAGVALHGVLFVAFVVGLFRASMAAPGASEASRIQWCRELRDYGRPFVLIGVGGWLLQYADRWIVAHYFGEAQAGWFALAGALSGVVPYLASGGLMQWAFPRVFRRADAARTRADWLRLARWCDGLTAVFLGLTVVGLWLLTMAGPHLVPWLIDARYEPALVMVFASGMAVVASIGNQFYYLLLQGQHNSLGIVRSVLAVAAVKTVGGLVAAGISWAAYRHWLVLSAPLSLLLARTMVRWIMVRGVAASEAAPGRNGPAER